MKRLPLALSSIAFLLCLCELPSLATSGTKYAALRNRLEYNPALTYEKVSQKPTQFAGRLLELRGKVSGSAGGGEDLSILLSMADGKSVFLDIPPFEAEMVRLYPSSSLRALVEVAAVPYSNEPLLKVKAVVLETDIEIIEKREAAIEKAREKQRRDSERNAARAYLNGSRGATSSRHGSPTPATNVPATGNLAALEQFYAKYLDPSVQPLFAPYTRFIDNHNKKLGVARAGEIAASLLRVCWSTKVDPRLVVAMVIAESDFDPNSTSRTGAAGLGQLMPGTARSLGVSNPYDIAQNLEGSITYLKSRLDSFRERGMPDGTLSYEQIRLAMAAYNAGMGAVKKYGGVPPYRETQAYVKRIEKLYRELCG